MAGFAVVTGAAMGIGYNLAKVLAEEGYDLAIVDRDETTLEKAKADFVGQGVGVKAIVADLAKFDDVERFWQEVQGIGRPLDAIAINAGFGVGGLFVETSLEDEMDLVRTNVEGTVHVAKHAVKHMVDRGSGRILITSSIAGEMVCPREAVYGASKAFDLWFGKSLQAELKNMDSAVTVTILQPGPVDTNFFHRAGMDDTDAGTKGKKESEPYDVAKQAVQAMLKGEKQLYAASLKTKIEGALLGVIPDAVSASMHEKMAKPQREK